MHLLCLFTYASHNFNPFSLIIYLKGCWWSRKVQTSVETLLRGDTGTDLRCGQCWPRENRGYPGGAVQDCDRPWHEGCGSPDLCQQERSAKGAGRWRDHGKARATKTPQHHMARTGIMCNHWGWFGWRNDLD